MIEQAGPRPSQSAVAFPMEPTLLRVALYVLTSLSLVAALFVEPAIGGAVARGALARPWLFLPLAVYGFFFVVYCVDRWGLVKRGYPAGKALFQFVFGLLFALLLLPSSQGQWQTGTSRGVERLLEHPEAAVRAAAVEAIGFRGADSERVHRVLSATRDNDPHVRDAAYDVLASWSGRSRGELGGLMDWAQSYSGEKVSSKKTSSETLEGTR